MADDKFTIRLTIMGRSYPVVIDRRAEESYRRAEADINNTLSAFRKQFRASDEEYLALAALQMALRGVEMEMSRSLGDDLDALKEIENEIDAYFQL